MTWKKILLVGIAATAYSALAQPTNSADRLREFKRRAGPFNSVITLPHFELNTNEVRVSVKQTIATGKAALDRIGALKPRNLTFEHTLRALDDLDYEISLTDNRLSVLKETSTN